MPIHDFSYRHWQGVRTHEPPALVLGGAQMRVALHHRAVKVLLLLSGLYVIGYLVILYIETMPREGLLGFLRDQPVLRVDARSMRTFMAHPWGGLRLLHFLLCLAAGAEVIALDRRYRSLQIYLARPLRVIDYLGGKALPLVMLLSLTTWVPALGLLVLKTATTASLQWLQDEPYLPFAIVGYALVLIATLTTLTLAVSCLSSSPRLASGQMVAVFLLPWMAAAILTGLTRDDGWRHLSLTDNLDQVCSWFFRRDLPYEMSPWVALAVLVLVAAASLWLLLRRVRAVDVVGSS